MTPHVYKTAITGQNLDINCLVPIVGGRGSLRTSLKRTPFRPTCFFSALGIRPLDYRLDWRQAVGASIVGLFRKFSVRDIVVSFRGVYLVSPRNGAAFWIH